MRSGEDVGPREDVGAWLIRRRFRCIRSLIVGGPLSSVLVGGFLRVGDRMARGLAASGAVAVWEGDTDRSEDDTSEGVDSVWSASSRSSMTNFRYFRIAVLWSHIESSTVCMVD